MKVNFKGPLAYIVICISLLVSSMNLMPVNGAQLVLTATSGCKENTLAWNSVQGIQYYWPYQIFDDGSEYPLIDFASKSLSFTHKDLEDGKEYCYIVKATDDKGKELSRSAKVCAKPDCSKEDDNCIYRMEFVIDSKSYFLDGTPYANDGSMLVMDSPPVIVNNRTFMPAKYVVDNLKDASIQWNASTKEVKIIATLRPSPPPRGKHPPVKNVTLVYKIGKSTVSIDGKDQPIDKTNSKIAPMIIDGRTMIPFRNLGENLNAVVDYIPSDKRIILDFNCLSKKTPIENVGKPLNPVIKTLCGCIDSIVIAAARTKGPGVQATVTFLPDCNLSAIPMILDVNSYLSASNSSNTLYNYSDVINPSSNPATGFPRPTDGWDMPSYVGSWEGQIKPGTTNDRTWCATIKYYTSGGQNHIVSWEMHPEREECCTEIVCACIYGYDEDTSPGHIRLFIQDDCLDQPSKLHVFSVPFNMSCTNPPAGSSSYLVYNYIGDYPNGTKTGTVNGVTKKKWCIKYKTNSAGDFLSWEMTPDNCECSCIDTCKGCLVSLTPTPSCNGNIIPQTQWMAVFDFDCNPATTNDRTTYNQSSVASSTTAGAVYVSLANLWRRCNCGQSTNSRTFTTSADFNTGVKHSVDHNPTADQLEIQYPVTTTPFPHIWIPNWNDYTVSKVSTTTGDVLARYRVSSRTSNPNPAAGPSRTTVDKDGNCWVAIRDTGSVVKILNIPTSSNTSQDETDLRPWGQDSAIQYEVILDHASQGVYKPTVPGQNFTGTYTTNSGPRAVAVDENNNVWVGTRDTQKIYKITQSGTNATLNLYYDIASATYTPGRYCKPYGAVVDKCGSLWILGGKVTDSNGLNTGRILKLTNASTSTTPNPIFIIGDQNFYPYSMTLNPNSDFLYLSSSYEASVYVYSIPTAVNTNGVIWNGQVTIKYSHISTSGGGWHRGIAFDKFGHLWTSNSTTGAIRRFTCNTSTPGIVTAETTGVVLADVPAGWYGPAGIALDTDGDMWIPYISNSSGAVFFTPNGGSSSCSLTRVNVMGGHYTYSDMTGSIVNSITAPTGHWTTPVIDAGCDNPTWSQLLYQSVTPGNSSLELYCSSSTTGIPGSWSTFAPMTTPFIPPAGKRYIKIKILFRSGIDNCRHVSPILKDITVKWSCQTSVNCCADLCLDGAGKIVSITPRIGQEPCCQECDWTRCQKVVSVEDAQGSEIKLGVKDSVTGSTWYLYGDRNLVAENDPSIPLSELKIGKCAKFCIIKDDAIPPHHRIIRWQTVPSSDPCCKEPTDCKWVCGTINTDSAGGCYRFNENGFTGGQTNSYCIPTNMPSQTTAPFGHQVVSPVPTNPGQYVKDFGEYACADACIDSDGNVVKWVATVKSNDTCCPCKETCGKIIKKDDFSKYHWTITIQNSSGGTDVYEIRKGMVGIGVGNMTFEDFYKDNVCISICFDPNTNIVSWWKPGPKECCDIQPVKPICYCLKVKSVVGVNVICTDFTGNTYTIVPNPPNVPSLSMMNLGSTWIVQGNLSGTTITPTSITATSQWPCKFKKYNLEIINGVKTIKKNGQNITPSSSPPYINNGDMFVPFRSFAEMLDANGTWDPHKMIGIYKLCNESITIVFEDGKKVATVNGQLVPLQSAPTIINGVFFVPIVDILEYLGATLSWNGDKLNVELELCPCLEEKPQDCRWICAQFRVTTNTPTPLYQAYEVTAENPFYYIPANLASQTTDMEGNTGYTSYSGPKAYYDWWQTVHPNTGPCVQLCIDKQGNVIKWVATPDAWDKEKQVCSCPCVTIKACVLEVNPDPSTPYQYIITVKIDDSSGIIKTYYVKKTLWAKTYVDHDNDPNTPPIPMSLVDHDNDPNTPPISMNFEGWVDFFKKGEICVELCVDDKTQVIKEWYPRLFEECCKQSCCKWDLGMQIEPRQIRFPDELNCGESATRSLCIWNYCPAGTSPLIVTGVTYGPNTSGNFACPPNYSLNANDSKCFQFTVTMPKDCKPGQEVTFRVVVLVKNCGEKIFEVKIKCKCDSICCDWSIGYKSISGQNAFPAEMCNGETFTKAMYIMNNCPTGSNSITVTAINAGTNTNIQLKQTLPIVVNAQSSMIFDVTFVMPKTCTSGDEYVVSFVVETKECGKKVFSQKIICKCNSICCDLKINYGLPGGQRPVTFPYELACGEKVSRSLGLFNNCPKESKPVTITNVTYSANTTSDLVLTPNPTVNPGSAKYFMLTFTMPRDCKDGQEYVVGIKIETKDCGVFEFLAKVICKCKPAICNVQTSLITQLPTGFGLCKGETFKFKYKLTNESPQSIVINLVKVSTTDPVAFDPATSFTLAEAGAPGSQKEIYVIFTMPECKPGQSITMQWNFTKDCGNTEAPKTYKIACIECFCKDNKSVLLSNIKNYPQEGKLVGLNTSTKTEVVIYYDKANTKFNTIKNSDALCYQVCYKEVAVKGGGVKFEGVDIRIYPCPQNSKIPNNLFMNQESKKLVMSSYSKQVALATTKFEYKRDLV